MPVLLVVVVHHVVVVVLHELDDAVVLRAAPRLTLELLVRVEADRVVRQRGRVVRLKVEERGWWRRRRAVGGLGRVVGLGSVVRRGRRRGRGGRVVVFGGVSWVAGLALGAGETA